MKIKMLITTFLFVSLNSIPNDDYGSGDTTMEDISELKDTAMEDVYNLTPFTTTHGEMTITYNLDTYQTNQTVSQDTLDKFNRLVSGTLTHENYQFRKGISNLHRKTLRKAKGLDKVITKNESGEFVIVLGLYGNITIKNHPVLSGSINGIDNNFIPIMYQFINLINKSVHCNYEIIF